MPTVKYAVLGETGDPSAGCTGPAELQGTASAWGLGMLAIPSPVPGTGNTCLYITVAPGPGAESGDWVAPPDTRPVAVYEPDPNGPAPWVQRVKMWVGPERNQPTTFGWNADTEPVYAQASAIVGLSSPNLTDDVISPPVEGNDTTLGFWPVYNNYEGVVLAIATGQSGDSILSGPPGYSQIINHTDPSANPGGASNVNRALAVFAKAGVQGSESIGAATFSGSTGAHRNFSVGFWCEPTTGQTAPTYLPIANNRIDIRLDPADRSTWGHNRTRGQILAAGTRFNPGQPDNGPYAPLMAFDANDELHNFAMEDGDTRRLHAEQSDGIDWLVPAYQFNTNSNYQTPSQAAATFGSSSAYASHGYVDTGVGKSDPLLFDGSRFDISYLETADLVRTGPGATEFAAGFLFRPQWWMWGTDPTSAIWAYHNAVGQNGSGPLRFMIDSGRCRLISNYSATPIEAATPANPSVSANNSTTGLELGSFALNPPDSGTSNGSIEALVVRGRIDPSSNGNGFLKMWRLVNGNWSQLVDRGKDYGYYYTDTTVSGQFFPKHFISYDFHQYPTETLPNWDTNHPGTFKNVRRFPFGYGFETKQTVTDQEMFDYLQWVMTRNQAT